MDSNKLYTITVIISRLIRTHYFNNVNSSIKNQQSAIYNPQFLDKLPLSDIILSTYVEKA